MTIKFESAGMHMPWDTQRTKAKLLAAATAEFSERGLAGARVDRIAAAAGVNKERIYQYFGKKDDLFDTVLAVELARVMVEIPISGRGPAAVGDYAGRLFDRHADDGTLPRLQFWEGLERGGHIVERASRAANCASKVNSLLDALPGVERVDAADLLLTIVTLCDGWPVIGQLDALLSADAEAEVRFVQRRAFIVRTVILIAEFLQSSGRTDGSSSNQIAAVPHS
jgi:AcrR family transcriptional regulator